VQSTQKEILRPEVNWKPGKLTESAVNTIQNYFGMAIMSNCCRLLWQQILDDTQKVQSGVATFQLGFFFIMYYFLRKSF